MIVFQSASIADERQDDNLNAEAPTLLHIKNRSIAYSTFFSLVIVYSAETDLHDALRG